MEKIKLANLPTEIMKLNRLSEKYKKNIYIKRDDYTGTEISGNKIRKLEYSLAEALENKCDTVITVGAIQSNHCRATAAACAKLGLDCHLILRGNIEKIEGNLFLDYFLGSTIYFVGEDDNMEEETKKIFEKLEKQGKKAYIIPMGASNAVGSYGYIDAFNEIVKQEYKNSCKFETIVVPIGSGGTYSGLWYGNYKNKMDKNILGFSVNKSKEDFKEEIENILKEIDKYVKDFKNININDSYIGEGYAKATDEELKFYYEIAKLDGIILDPCYTGKAFRGLINEIEKGNIYEENILFIHTGGLLGWTEDSRNRIFNIIKEN